ncbi:MULTISPECIES: LacI family DNA-binding transcriptional regulator [unclassified Actinomyces]|uniref:LacI family DNA-binding transcriptional regulator n=1 Tax=unclassified Actinomyces TaxID=2609248 RepID=UPI0020177502|nr:MULTISPECIES: LacI family DNA-binding transcriptional regulator [unclassified Actinomyces]MCL3776860.1 LacI family DNA-binding transcriptional regulator [Actinomyces sp. AC-20-1]MCL3790452.1 LacI family DNA-binding transcriptional regulator [Actinomyces sp. 187325]MCL3792739.1 LacI family DNA-binding transcriptional regulator [Actinomyces sp. 186855]MCL3794663.1 LacI family DNA-binding transcriptional regulator [Actinomyces sp. 217892]
MARRKTVGIRDVAREAQVSVTTVSHILNNVSYARASEETRQRVRDTAARLGYGPNRMARSLRLQRSEMIGLLSEDIATTPHAGRILLGAQETAREAGLTLVLINTTQSATDTERDVEALLRQQVDGVLYATMYHRVVEVPEGLGSVPTVLIDAQDVRGKVSSVVPDEAAGAAAAVQELIDHGHRRIGFITNTDDVPATHGRLAGYRASLEGAGVPFDSSLVVARVSETEGGYEAALAVLRSSPRPTALFCYNDRMAMGAYRAAAELGLRVPDDLSIVGFDNQEIVAEGLYPSLTTVALPHYEMGRWAMKRLIAMLGTDGEDAPPVEHVVLPCPLIRRESVAVARAIG